MKLTGQIAKHFREVYFGDNWTEVDFKSQLADVTWQEAIARVYELNSIATLVFHAGYYVAVLIPVLEGQPLNAKNVDSFQHPPITSQDDWNRLLDIFWANAERCAALLEQMPESLLWEIFKDEKYGHYYRNIQGTIEHLYYHLGQIVLLKKILRQPANSLD